MCITGNYSLLYKGNRFLHVLGSLSANCQPVASLFTRFLYTEIHCSQHHNDGSEATDCLATIYKTKFAYFLTPFWTFLGVLTLKRG